MIAVDDASDPPVAAVAGVAGAAAAHQRRTGRRPQRRPRGRRHAARRVRRHRRPPRAGLARAAARPLRRRPRRARRATRRQRAGRRADRRLRAGPLAARPRSRAGSHRPRHPAQLRPGGGASSCAPTRCGPIDGFDRGLRFGEDVDAVWRLVEAGWRCRYEPASVVHHRPRGSWRGARRPARRLRLVGRRRLSKRHPGALAPVRISGWSGAAWGLLAAGQPIPALAVAGAHDRWPWSASCPASRPPSRCGSPGSATCTPAACSPTPAGGRGGRCCSPARSVSKRVRAVAVAGRGAGAAAAAASRSSSTTSPTAPGCGRASSPSASRDRCGPGSRRGPAAPPRPDRRPPACTVARRDAAPDRRHRRLAGPRRPRRPLATPGSCRSSRATATASAAGRWRRSPPSSPTRIAVGTVHELDHVPAGVTPVVLTPAARPPTRPRPCSPSARSPTSTPSTAGRVGCSSSWRRRCGGSARPPRRSCR